MNEPVEQYRVRALREFTLSPGRRLQKGEVTTVEGKQAQALIAVQAVVRVRDDEPDGREAVGLYERRDMRAIDANSDAASPVLVPGPERQGGSKRNHNTR